MAAGNVNIVTVYRYLARSNCYTMLSCATPRNRGKYLMDFPGIWTQPLMLSSMGRYGTLEPALSMLNGSSTPSSGSFPANTGDVVLAPFTIPGPCLVRSMWWYNGSTVAGNNDAGIYTVNTNGTTITRLCSTGAVAVANASTLQSANISTSELRLEPGTYYLAISNSSTGIIFGRAVPTAVTSSQYQFGWQTAATSAGSGTLAATLTAATWTGLRYPVFGFSRLPSGQY